MSASAAHPDVDGGCDLHPMQELEALGLKPRGHRAQFETWAPVMGDEQTDARLQRINPTVFLCQRLQSCADFENLVSSEGMINV